MVTVEHGSRERSITCSWKDAPAWPRKLAVDITLVGRWRGGHVKAGYTVCRFLETDKFPPKNGRQLGALKQKPGEICTFEEKNGYFLSQICFYRSFNTVHFFSFFLNGKITKSRAKN